MISRQCLNQINTFHWNTLYFFKASGKVFCILQFFDVFRNYGNAKLGTSELRKDKRVLVHVIRLCCGWVARNLWKQMNENSMNMLRGQRLILDNEVMHAFWIKGAQILVIQFSPPWNSLLKWFISHMVYCFFFQCAPWLKLLFVEISNF